MKPRIVVTNDDGVTSPGIALLVEVAKKFGHVYVVAPDSPQSGMGHAITIGEPLRLDKVSIFKGVQEQYDCSGTPADCVKLAKNYILKDEKPDLVLSGVNHGNNTSISVIYSGTMSAAVEGAVEGIPSIGFSLCDYSHEANMKHIVPLMEKVISNVLEKGMLPGMALNVNFPSQQEEPVKGLRLCRQANAYWKEEFDERFDPHGRKYFWLTGALSNEDAAEDTDEWAIANNYASIVPTIFDLTAHHALGELHKRWEM